MASASASPPATAAAGAGRRESSGGKAPAAPAGEGALPPSFGASSSGNVSSSSGNGSGAEAAAPAGAKSPAAGVVAGVGADDVALGELLGDGHGKVLCEAALLVDFRELGQLVGAGRGALFLLPALLFDVGLVFWQWWRVGKGKKEEGMRRKAKRERGLHRNSLPSCFPSFFFGRRGFRKGEEASFGCFFFVNPLFSLAPYLPAAPPSKKAHLLGVPLRRHRDVLPDRHRQRSRHQPGHAGEHERAQALCAAADTEHQRRGGDEAVVGAEDGGAEPGGAVGVVDVLFCWLVFGLMMVGWVGGW